jgi:hypothetical protein
MESERDRKIRERAYELWVQGGQSEGSSEQHWLQAEQEFGAGSESPLAGSAGAGATAEKAAPVKKTTRARSAAPSSEAAPKPAAAAAKRATTKSGTKGETPKAVSTKR